MKIEFDTEQLKNDIVESIKPQLEDLKKFFQPKEPTEFLTRQETANLLKVDLSTIHNYTKKGLLTSYGIGSRVFFKRKEVEQALVKLN